MQREPRSVMGQVITVIGLLALAAAFYLRAASNLERIDYRNSNFVFFWLAGRMVVSGESPYDSGQWLAAHDTNSVNWRPNRIFPYPLPLAYLVAPLGLLSLAHAYMGWQLVSEILIAAAVWILLKRWSEPRLERMFVPLVLALLFFGPVYLSLQIGALGAFTLAIVVAAIQALDSRRMLLGGILLSLTLLKPPQGLPLVLLACVWLLSRREWKILLGLAAGALLLALIGMLGDPLWPSKFATAGEAVLDRTLGVQSNALGLAFLACSGDYRCAWLFGGCAAVMLLLATGAFLHRRSAALDSWEAFNLIIPTAFVATPYLWSYDQILYIVPVVWIVRALINKTSSYLPAFGFLIVLVVVSLLALLTQANTRSDVTSLLTTFIVVACVVALRWGGRSAGAAARDA